MLQTAKQEKCMIFPRLSQKYLVNFKHDKFLWDLADSWSLRKRILKNGKIFDIRPHLGGPIES